VKTMTTHELSSSAERIADIAMRQFADNGYDAASLNDIATEAGIRKASLYAHFSSKDALYSVVLGLALRAEHTYVEADFTRAKRVSAVPGERYLVNLHPRFVEAASLRFLLRAAFYPPATVRPAVTAGFNEYLNTLRAHFLSTLEQAYPHSLSEALALTAETYMAFIDSLHVDLIYGHQDNYLRRLDAVLRVLNNTYATTMRPRVDE